MRISALWRQTEGAKVGGLDGLNLFFGALLGANLGTVEKLPLFDYVKLIILLAGTVMTIRIISTSKQRRYTLGLAGFYVALIAGMLLSDDLRPQGMSPDELNRIIVTLGIWISLVVLIELSPVRPDEDESEVPTSGGSATEETQP